MSKHAQEQAVDDLYRIRHSVAHVLAQAVQRLWPDTQITLGPPIDYGAYYDFLFNAPISEEDFPKIEKEMRKIINQGQTFRHDELPAKEAKEYWKERKQPFKVEMIEDLEKSYPGMKERLCDDKGSLRRFINIYVNEEDIRFLKMDQTPLKDGDEVSIIPAIAGGGIL